MLNDGGWTDRAGSCSEVLVWQNEGILSVLSVIPSTPCCWNWAEESKDGWGLCGRAWTTGWRVPAISSKLLVTCSIVPQSSPHVSAFPGYPAPELPSLGWYRRGQSYTFALLGGHGPRALCPEQQWQMLFRGTWFIRASLTATDPPLALCTLTARLGLFTLDPVQNWILHPCAETASRSLWGLPRQRSGAERGAWQLLCCWYITLQCPDLLQSITPYLIGSINPRLPIEGNVWSGCKMPKGLIFFWRLLLTSSSWAKPTHTRCWDTQEEHVTSHQSITLSPAATSPPEPPASHTHADRRYLYLPPSETWGLTLLCARIMLKVIMGTPCHC